MTVKPVAAHPSRNVPSVRATSGEAVVSVIVADLTVTKSLDPVIGVPWAVKSGPARLAVEPESRLTPFVRAPKVRDPPVKLTKGEEPVPVSELFACAARSAGPENVTALLTASKSGPVSERVPFRSRVAVSAADAPPLRLMKGSAVLLLRLPFTWRMSPPKVSVLLVARSRSVERLRLEAGGTS